MCHCELSQTSAQRHRTYFLLNNKAVNVTSVRTSALSHRSQKKKSLARAESKVPLRCRLASASRTPMLDRASSDAAIWSAVSDPEILIGTFSYLLLKPLLRNSGLVDERKGAYRTSMIW